MYGGAARQRWRSLGWLLAALVVAAPACAQSGAASDAGIREPVQARFPRPARPVAPIVSPNWDTEADRDRNGEAERVFEILGLAPGMRVADIGAGTGYYTVRLARRLGPTAMVYAQDVHPGYLAQLRSRLDREGLMSVTTVHGTPTDPRLPPGSVDIALLSHMYHEIENPYEFLYRLHAALAPAGRVAVIDLDRPTASHGTPSALLRCEMEALGYRQRDFYRLTPAQGYLAIFVPPDRLPPVASIRPCAQ